MESGELINPNPTVRTRSAPRSGGARTVGERVFDAIRDIRDPEHPHTLEELSVVTPDSVAVQEPADDSPGYGRVTVTFTPTVPHCSLASVIGLSIVQKVRATGALPARGEHYYKLTVCCAEDAHAQAADITRQLGDKERVAAALENPRIAALLQECVEHMP